MFLKAIQVNFKDTISIKCSFILEKYKRGGFCTTLSSDDVGQRWKSDDCEYIGSVEGQTAHSDSTFWLLVSSCLPGSDTEAVQD